MGKIKPHNKRKIINDPVYGFITVPSDLIFDLIEHPWFQRLRRIKQLAMTHLVYPGALHTRFQHAIGAMHLMTQAIEVLKLKGHDITDEEAEAVMIAILLHDIGHGPFSHALESSIVHGVNHEDISAIMMDRLNMEFHGKLELAISIFRNKYSKKFLHQLVSSQLDMDRLDYLKRDSFFTGVSEGVISTDRIIKMLDVKDDQLVVAEKGIYSIEKFIIARRLMYWQVYLHKTVVAGEYLLVNILNRAKNLAGEGVKLFATPALSTFLYQRFSKDDFQASDDILNKFSQLDDYDIFASAKVWSGHTDKVLSSLCEGLVNRHLNRVEIQNKPFDEEYISKLKVIAGKKYGWTDDELTYFFHTDAIENNAYDKEHENINILFNNGSLVDIATASDHLNISVLAKTVTKYFLYYPKSCSEHDVNKAEKYKEQGIK